MKPRTPPSFPRRAAASALASLALAAGCGGAPLPPEAPPAGPASSAAPVDVHTDPSGTATVADATAFVSDVNARLRELYVESSRMAWVKSTYITEDTEVLAAKASERLMAYQSQAIKDSLRFRGLDLPPDVARSLYLLKFSAGLPAPEDAKKRAELAELDSKLSALYGKGKPCSPKLVGHGKDKKAECLTLTELSDVIAKSRDPELLLEAWSKWRSISPPMRPMYERMVQLGNEGARELGFADMGEIWRGRYDMPAEQFVAETERLWTEVEPLYDELHCFVRARLRKKYGEALIPKGAPIPAHLLGNMWAQEWSNLYDLVEPFPGKGLPDLTRQLEKKKYDEKKLVELGEKFFVSLGMDPLPKTFWERSQFVRPRDRDVECHASAWDVNMGGDLRIKMCIKIDHEDLVTIHHELGHNYYFHYYGHHPVLFQEGANDGFHEGIGDTLALSVTPEYLAKLGLYDKVPSDEKADINELMKRALEGVAFLPFGKLIDQWRWEVFAGKTPPSQYNAAWWRLRTTYQGIAPPSARTESDFDPGAKYHIPGNVPYTRYYLARILQYQFHEALCRAIGHQGPLHRCSIYGDKRAGEKMIAMLRLGASKPWPDALEAIGAGRTMSSKPIAEYYRPLVEWMKKQNEGEKCGW